MNPEILRNIRSVGAGRPRSVDALERLLRKVRESLAGVDGLIFDKTIRYYQEVRGQHFTRSGALARALAKDQHKKAWFARPRESVEAKMQFYEEVHVYPFRQPYNK